MRENCRAGLWPSRGPVQLGAFAAAIHGTHRLEQFCVEPCLHGDVTLGPVVVRTLALRRRPGLHGAPMQGLAYGYSEM